MGRRDIENNKHIYIKSYAMTVNLINENFLFKKYALQKVIFFSINHIHMHACLHPNTIIKMFDIHN